MTPIREWTTKREHASECERCGTDVLLPSMAPCEAGTCTVYGCPACGQEQHRATTAYCRVCVPLWLRMLRWIWGVKR
jgi:hypothetical protein